MEIKNVNPNKLHDELIENGIVPILNENNKKENEYIAEKTWITFPEGTDMDLVQRIVDKHVPTPLPPQPSEKERLEALEQAMLEIVMGGM